MECTVKVWLFGSLARGVLSQRPLEVKLQRDTPLESLLQELGVKRAEVKLIMINHRSVHLHSHVRPGDRVSLFPKEYAIFADWKDLMSP